MFFTRRHRDHSNSKRPGHQTSHPPRAHHGSNVDDAQAQQRALKAVAKETKQVMPALLRQLQTTNKARDAEKYSKNTLRYLDPNRCPAHPKPATIKVVNQDTMNAAIQLMQYAKSRGHDVRKNPAMVVNFANEKKPGGGWLKGKMAQEEALCYRSSLAQSLHRRFYPLRWNELIYSPYALVIRRDMASGHALFKSAPEDMPVVSCVTIAARRNPKIHTFTLHGHPGGAGPSQPGGPSPAGIHATSSRKKQVFENDHDRSEMKQKMRLTLRAAAYNRHGLLVLGALGCGVYANPPEDVAHCWLEVLRENEFSGNWWREVWFAVYDPNHDGNFGIFNSVLSGHKV